MEFQGADITWLGHAGFMIKYGKKHVYIDPFKIGRGRPDADLVLITHNHYDHLSIEDLDSVATEKTVYLAPEDCFEKLDDLPGTARIVKAGKEYEVEGLTVRVVPAYNVDKKFHPQDKGWVGYVIESAGASIYHAGDTDLIPEMDDIKCDLAMLPVSGTYVMNPEEASKAAKKLKLKHAIPMHWGAIVGDRSNAEEFKKKASCPVTILDKE